MTKRVLITGAASGLGWEFAKQYQDLGWHVILLDRDAERLAECDQRLSGPHATYCVNLTDLNQVAESLDAIINEPLDLLINNAGITHRSQASVTDPEVFSHVMAVNWFAPVWLSQKCLPALEQASGGIICISSMAAKMPVPGRAAYGASKSALAQHFETWRPELLRRGIDLLMVYPSFLSTAIEENALGSDGNKTTRPRSVVGSVQDAGDMATRIIKAQQSGKQRLNTPQFTSRLGAWLWVHAPWLYQKLTWRKFAQEFVQLDD
jgi:short-subunit dehydrogenase